MIKINFVIYLSVIKIKNRKVKKYVVAALVSQ